VREREQGERKMQEGLKGGVCPCAWMCVCVIRVRVGCTHNE